MASFIDGAAMLEAELRDDLLFLYSRQELSTASPDRWQVVSNALDALLPKLESWERWRDEGFERRGAQPFVPTAIHPDDDSIDRADADADAAEPPLFIERRMGALHAQQLRGRRKALWPKLAMYGVFGYAAILVVLGVVAF